MNDKCEETPIILYLGFYAALLLLCRDFRLNPRSKGMFKTARFELFFAPIGMFD